MIHCPSTGQPCYHTVCNAGGWPCEARVQAAAPAPRQQDEIIETDDGVILSGPAPDVARFEIEEEP